MNSMFNSLSYIVYFFTAVKAWSYDIISDYKLIELSLKIFVLKLNQISMLLKSSKFFFKPIIALK